jgi:hypothetical protein
VKDEFGWDDPSVVVRSYGSLAVYVNPYGDVVLRQEAGGMAKKIAS